MKKLELFKFVLYGWMFTDTKCRYLFYFVLFGFFHGSYYGSIVNMLVVN